MACSARSGSQPGQISAIASTDPTAQALAEFMGQVDDYARLHRSAARSVDPLRKGLSAAELWAREKRLADTIRARRPWAQQGDLFTAGVTPVLVEIVQSFLSSSDGAS